MLLFVMFEQGRTFFTINHFTIGSSLYLSGIFKLYLEIKVSFTRCFFLIDFLWW